MPFPLAPVQLQENPRAAPSSRRRAARVRAAPCAVLPALGLQLFPSARARNEKLALLPRPFRLPVSPTAAGKTGQRGRSSCKRPAPLLAWELFIRRRGHLLAKGSWGSGRGCRGVPGPRGGTEPLVAEGAILPGHRGLGREIISGFSPWLVGSSWLGEPRKARGAPQQGLP